MNKWACIHCGEIDQDFEERGEGMGHCLLCKKTGVVTLTQAIDLLHDLEQRGYLEQYLEETRLDDDYPELDFN